MPIDIVGTEDYTDGPYELPVSPDQGNDVFSVLEDFMNRMAVHNHDGSNSKEISLNIDKDITVFLTGVDITWNVLGNGNYRALFTMPVSATFDGNIRKFYYKIGASDYKEFYPTVEKVSASTYYIYSNDNTIDVKVVTL